MAGYYGQYLALFLIFVFGLVFVWVGMRVNRLLRPEAPGGDKYLPYECGVDPVGEGWAQTQVRYYVYAFFYVVFAIDAVYLFPWALVFDAPGFGMTTLVEMFVFLGFLAVGILYGWRTKALTWT